MPCSTHLSQTATFQNTCCSWTRINSKKSLMPPFQLRSQFFFSLPLTAIFPLHTNKETSLLKKNLQRPNQDTPLQIPLDLQVCRNNNKRPPSPTPKEKLHRQQLLHKQPFLLRSVKPIIK